MALLTNGGNGKGMAQVLMNEIFTTRAGVTPTKAPEPTPGFSFDPSRYIGRYRNVMETITVTAEGGGLVATITPSPASAVISGEKRVELKPVDAELFVGVTPGYTESATYHFLPGEDGETVGYLHSGVRAHKRVE
jgi:hypothetical protein